MHCILSFFSDYHLMHSVTPTMPVVRRLVEVAPRNKTNNKAIIGHTCIKCIKKWFKTRERFYIKNGKYILFFLFFFIAFLLSEFEIIWPTFSYGRFVYQYIAPVAVVHRIKICNEIETCN